MCCLKHMNYSKNQKSERKQRTREKRARYNANSCGRKRVEGQREGEDVVTLV